MFNMLPTRCRHWLYLIFFVMAGLTLSWEKPSQAAPHQTVPRFTPQPTHTPMPVPLATAAPSIAQLSIDRLDSERARERQTALNLSGLTLLASPIPQFVHQEEIVELQFEIINESSQTATEVILSDALPLGLDFIEVKTDGTVKEEKGIQAETIVQIFWPHILPDEKVSANVRLRVVDDLPDGAVLENLAALYTGAFPVQTVGIQIGLPPSALPYFD